MVSSRISGLGGGGGGGGALPNSMHDAKGQSVGGEYSHAKHGSGTGY